MSALPDLMRRLDRKLDIQRGLHLSYDDLAMLVASGAYATLQSATREHLERQCREHVDQSRSTNEAISASTQERGATTKSSGTTETEDAREALARAQTSLRLVGSPSIGTTSKKQAANTSRQSAGRARS